MLIAVPAIVPRIFVVIPMVIAIIGPFPWPRYAARNEADQYE